MVASIIALALPGATGRGKDFLFGSPRGPKSDNLAALSAWLGDTSCTTWGGCVDPVHETSSCVGRVAGWSGVGGVVAEGIDPGISFPVILRAGLDAVMTGSVMEGPAIEVESFVILRLNALTCGDA